MWGVRGSRRGDFARVSARSLPILLAWAFIHEKVNVLVGLSFIIFLIWEATRFLVVTS